MMRENNSFNYKLDCSSCPSVNTQISNHVQNKPLYSFLRLVLPWKCMYGRILLDVEQGPFVTGDQVQRCSLARGFLGWHLPTNYCCLCQPHYCQNELTLPVTKKSSRAYHRNQWTRTTDSFLSVSSNLGNHLRLSLVCHD